MKVGGIICEYNPFHKGHLYQIQKSKKDLGLNCIIGVMSSSFVQRGQAAVLDKYTRAKLAVENGLDLVLELPSYFSLQSAQNFARAGVEILNNIGLVDYLIFGSESNLEDLEKINRITSDKNINFQSYLKNSMDKGLSYSQAYFNFLIIEYPDLTIGSNDILGLEYLRTLEEKEIKAYTLKRLGPDYNSLESSKDLASASFIRNLLTKNKLEAIKSLVPLNVYEELISLKVHDFSLDKYTDLLKYKIFVEEAPMIDITGFEPGMDMLIKNKLIDVKTISELIVKASSKRHSKSRISRLIVSYLLDQKQDDLEMAFDSLYIRPLSFNSNGRKILAQIKKGDKLIDKFSKSYKNDNFLLNFELKASNLYNLGSHKYNEDFFKSPIYIK